MSDSHWLLDYGEAMRKGGLYWIAYCKFNHVHRAYYMAGFVLQNVKPYRESLEWIRQLTDDGDIESNPGPITMKNMDEISNSKHWKKY